MNYVKYPAGLLSQQAQTFYGVKTLNDGAIVASGKSLTLTGATVDGSPTWSLAQTVPGVVISGGSASAGSIMFASNTLKFCGGSSGGSFADSSGTSVGSYTAAGVWNLGVSADSNNAHIISGYIKIRAHSTDPLRFIGVDQNGSGNNDLLIQSGGGSQGYGGSIYLHGHSSSTNPGGMEIGLSNASSGVINFRNNAIGGGTVIGSCAYAGAWTFPINTGHTFGNDSTAAGTNITVRAGSSQNSHIVFRQNGTSRLFVGGDSGGGLIADSSAGDAVIAANSVPLRLGASITTTHAICSTSGAWTFGPSAGGVSHIANGSFTVKSASTDRGSYETAKTSTLNQNSYIDITIPQAFVGILMVNNTKAAGATVRTSSTFFVCDRYGNGSNYTQMNTVNGSGGGAPFTVTSGGSNIIRITNTHWEQCETSAMFIGGLGF